MKAVVLILATLFASHPILASEAVIRSAAGLYDAVYRSPNGSLPEFDLTATVTYVRTGEDGTPIAIALEDKTGCVDLHGYKGREAVRPGDVIRAVGKVSSTPPDKRAARPRSISRVGSTVPPAPVESTVEELLSGRLDCRLTRIVGTVHDICPSDLSAKWFLFVLNCGRERLYASVFCPEDPARLESMIGAKVSLTGVFIPFDQTLRKRMSHIFKLADMNAIRILESPQVDDRLLPTVESIGELLPSEISQLNRHRVDGTVIAVWQRNSALIRTDSGSLVSLALARSTPPRYGDRIRAVGFPESDLYNINLIRVRWKILASERRPLEPAGSVQITDLIRGQDEKPIFNLAYHGRAIRLRGILLNVPVANDSSLYLRCGDWIVPVDVSETPGATTGLSAGTEVEIAGTCVMETENWRPNAIITNIKRFFLVVREADDITIIAKPPWWTTGRLLAAIGLLLSLLLGIVIWNILLQKLADRRGADLAQAAIARAEADLKVYERTRLAVELHDSIAQNLTGVALEINTANRTIDTDLGKAHRHLDIASKSLKSCRDELRYCLWDLRNSALESTDMDEAIRRTLAPHTGDARLAVRFCVPRVRISDNTAHAILRIMRELSVNAVRHGKATSIRIAGSIEGDKLMLSVRDNGCGFDPSSCPGVDQGHFGLLGVRERIEGFEGKMRIDSSPGLGTKVTITLNVPQGDPSGKAT